MTSGSQNERYWGDPKWWRDFAALEQAIRDWRNHTAAAERLREAGEIEKAEAEFASAKEAAERAELLTYELKHYFSRPES